MSDLEIKEISLRTNGGLLQYKIKDQGCVFKDLMPRRTRVALSDYLEKNLNTNERQAAHDFEISQLETQLAEKDKLIRDLKDELGKERGCVDYFGGEGDHRTYLDVFDCITVSGRSVVEFDSFKFAEKAHQRIKERKEF